MSNARPNDRRGCLLAAGMLLLAGPLAAQIQTSPLAGQHGTAVIIAQTSSGGSNTHLIDPSSNRVIGIIKGLGPHITSSLPDHGACLPPALACFPRNLAHFLSRPNKLA